jgi:GxxExxY protein
MANGRSNSDAVSPETDALVRETVDASFKVHRSLGPGLLESVYEACLCRELSLRGVTFSRQRPVRIEYEGVSLDEGLRIDLLIDNAVLVELKAVERLMPLHEAQIMTYLRLSRIRVGLLINFNVRLFKHGIRRFVL